MKDSGHVFHYILPALLYVANERIRRERPARFVLLNEAVHFSSIIGAISYSVVFVVFALYLLFLNYLSKLTEKLLPPGRLFEIDCVGTNKRNSFELSSGAWGELNMDTAKRTTAGTTGIVNVFILQQQKMG